METRAGERDDRWRLSRARAMDRGCACPTLFLGSSAHLRVRLRDYSPWLPFVSLLSHADSAESRLLASGSSDLMRSFTIVTTRLQYDNALAFARTSRWLLVTFLFQNLSSSREISRMIFLFFFPSLTPTSSRFLAGAGWFYVRSWYKSVQVKDRGIYRRICRKARQRVKVNELG